MTVKHTRVFIPHYKSSFMYQYKTALQSYHDDSSTSRINDSYLLVFARCCKQAAVNIPRYGEDGVGVDSNDVQLLGSCCVPQNTLCTQKQYQFALIMLNTKD